MPRILILFTLLLSGASFSFAAEPEPLPEKIRKVIAERISVVGGVCVDGRQDQDPRCADARAVTVAAVNQGPPREGEALYRRYCISCHLSGAAGAPRLGDRRAWAPLIQKGMEQLMQTIIQGSENGLMPAKGLCNDCSQEEFQRVLDYMVDSSR